MKKFIVYGNVSASTMSVEIEANSPEEALDKFFDTDEASPSVCHHCTREIEVGEVYEGYVLDEEGNQVYTDAQKREYLSHIIELLKSDKSKEEIIKELIN